MGDGKYGVFTGYGYGALTHRQVHQVRTGDALEMAVCLCV